QKPVEFTEVASSFTEVGKSRGKRTAAQRLLCILRSNQNTWEVDTTVSSMAEMTLEQKSVPPTTEPDAPESDLPVTVIERRPGWHLVNVRELWRYRELLFFLTWRDIMVRYKQTALGAAWAVLQPFATMVV